jgi:predicted anti-sigma-YlaC factor YlaD
MEGDLKADIRLRIDEHLNHCEHCTAIYDGVRNVVELSGVNRSAGINRTSQEVQSAAA